MHKLNDAAGIGIHGYLVVSASKGSQPKHGKYKNMRKKNLVKLVKSSFFFFLKKLTSATDLSSPSL